MYKHFHSCCKAPHDILTMLINTFKTEISEKVYYSPDLDFDKLRERLEVESHLILGKFPTVLKEIKLKLLELGSTVHIDVIHNTKERTAVLGTFVFQKGGDA